MTNNSAEMGVGANWAIVTAQTLIDMPPSEGLGVCAEQAKVAARIHQGSNGEGQTTQAKTCQRLASVTGQIIADWQRNDTLPEVHDDFRPDLAKRHIAERYDPNPQRLSVALQRLKVVRYALPEILRQRQPSLESVRFQLDLVASNLAGISQPGSYVPNRQPSYTGLQDYRSHPRFRDDWR